MMKICFVSPYPKLTGVLKQTFAGLSDAPTIIEDTMVGEQTAARSAEKEGAEVLVTTDHHARHLKTVVTVPVIAIPLTVFDITHALSRARLNYGEPVALLEPFGPNPYLPSMREVLTCQINEYVFLDEKDASAKINNAKSDGCRSGVGGGIVAQAAENIGFPFVPLFPGTEAITHAFRQAQQVAEVRRIERYEAMKFKYTVQYAFTGIIVTDQYGTITVFNSAAEYMLMIKADQALNRPLNEVIQGRLLSPASKREPQIEEIKTIGRKQLVVNTVPIFDGGRFEGTIFTFREVAAIQSLEEKIRRASHERGLTAKMTFDKVVGVSPIAKEILNRAARFALSDETLLITGETGTGKEVFAQSVHNASPRQVRPFVAVSCASIPSSLLESELFGYAEGAFTGARRGGKQGFFELAHGGTIFLDEIGELSPETQVHLLRVLQEKELMRLGDAKVIPIDVRVIAATNKKLEEAVQDGRFRMDLYHRLNVLHIELPPLRERFEDILPLSHAILQHVCRNENLAEKLEAVIAKRLEILRDYDWPGNIRELENLIRRIVVSTENITEDSFEAEVDLLLKQALNNDLPKQTKTSNTPLKGDLKTLLRDLEQEIIRQRVAECGGSKSELAKKLGIGRATLWRKLRG
jgi:transcriptional regulator with PAS, ATPase and Fis domain